MNEELLTDAIARDFLLGKLDETESLRIEDLFLTDAHVREEILIAEQELIDDYLDDSLTSEDNERFLARFAQSDEQRQKLQIAKAIRDRALAAPQVTQPVPASASLLSRLSKSYFKPVFLVPIAVGIVIAVVLGFVWLNRVREQRKRVAVEAELAQLNSPNGLRESSAQLISLELRPGTVRSVEGQVEVKLKSETRVVELRLPWIRSESYSTYQAELHSLTTSESWTIRNLQPANSQTPNASNILVRLPAHLLRPGQYQLRLTGITPSGSPAITDEYNFLILSQRY